LGRDNPAWCPYAGVLWNHHSWGARPLEGDPQPNIQLSTRSLCADECIHCDQSF
jgi:hypothetical protein